MDPHVRQRPAGRLVGRSGELDRLVAAASAPPAIILVEGEAGIGKSRLVRELLSALPAHRRLVGTCDPVQEPFPLGPLLEAIGGTVAALPDPARLSPIVGALSAVLPELADRLPAALPPLGDHRAERHRLLRAVMTLLGELGPAVLVLEDVHWADDGTAEFIAYLAARMPSNLALVVTARGETRDRLPIWAALARSQAATPVRVQLTPLALDDVGALAADLLGSTDLPARFASSLHDLTAGIPFVVEEVVASLREDRDGTAQVPARPSPGQDLALDGLAVPAALRDVVQPRLDTLDDLSREILGAAAVMAMAPDEELLSRVVDREVEAVARALSQALLAGLLHEDGDGRCRFRHALARQAVYESMPSPNRRWFHLRVAEVLHNGSEPLPVARLAHHYRLAGRLDDYVRYAEAAADRAVSHGDDAAAARFLLDAIAVPASSGDDRVRLVGKLAEAAVHGLAQSEAMPILESLLTGSDLPAWRRGELRFLLGRLHRQQGSARRGYEEIERSIADLAERPALLARALAILAVPEIITGRHVDEHVARSVEAAAVARVCADPGVDVAVGIATVSLRLELGDPDAGTLVDAWLASAELRANPREHARACLNWAQGCLHVGDLTRAQSLLEEGRDVAAGAEYQRATSVVELVAASLDRAAGRWSGLLDRCRELVREPLDFVAANLDAEFLLASMIAAVGDPGQARDRLRSVIRSAERSGVLWPLVPARACLARLLLADGNADDAVAEAKAGLEVIRAKGNWMWAGETVLVLVEALATQSDRGDAGAGVIAELAEDLLGRRAPAVQAYLAQCRAILAHATDPVAAEKDLIQARDEFARLGLRYEAARAAELLGSWTAPDDAGAGLRGAFEMFAAVGAHRDLSRLQRRLRELGLGVPSPRRGGRRSYGPELSPREHEVALLAAEGRTNAEIADRLFVSRRTVESHVASALRKLGARSRRELRTLIPPDGPH
jgi:DNA-binding CsgD family transcriptional regulator